MKIVLLVLAVALATTASTKKKHETPPKSYDLKGLAFNLIEHHDHYYSSTVDGNTYSFSCDETGSTTTCDDSHIIVSYVAIAGKTYAAIPDSDNASDYTVQDLAEGFGGFDALNDLLRKAPLDVHLGKKGIVFAYRDAGTTDRFGHQRICVPWKLQRGKKIFLHETCYDLNPVPAAIQNETERILP